MQCFEKVRLMHCGQVQYFLDFVHGTVHMHPTFTTNHYASTVSVKWNRCIRRLMCGASQPSIDRNLNLANQITQAMGYLHARGIVAKDLTIYTKNIFVQGKGGHH